MYKRIDFIDLLRGIAIILMIIYHFFYQSVLWVALNSKLLDNQIIEGIRLSSEILFISIAGVSSSFSRNNYKRGLKCVYFGILITLITYFCIPSELISFGILHFLGTSMIFYEFLKNRVIKIKPIVGTIISLAFFILTYLILYEEAYLDEIMKLPYISYLRHNGYLNFIGLKSSHFMSSDYFPIVPWIFLFFAGGFIGEEIKKKNIVRRGSYKDNFLFLKFLGRHSLFIYMIHIPIIIVVIFLLKLVSK